LHLSENSRVKKIICTSIILTLSIINYAQQQNGSSTINDIPAPPPLMMLNDKPYGYNQDKSIFSLASEYKIIKNRNAIQEEDGILKDLNSWWSYTYQNIDLSQDFIALAPNDKILSKRVFLQLLTTGDFYPVKTNNRNHLPCYKLGNLNTTDKEIPNTIIQWAGEKLFYSDMEGRELPPYNFKDLAGKTYNNVTTRGKIMVLKCWFIHCTACVKEFPDLNKLVDDYRNRKDLLFVSLASDNKPDLVNFLKTHKLNYAVIPNQQEYMGDKLHVYSYPTHIIVGKDGKIAKVLDNYNDLQRALKKEASRK
jgi:peroxiredoxin